jgi:hypothetical protein
VEENSSEDLVQLMDFDEEGYYEEETLENEHVEENAAEDLVLLMDFEEDG